MRNDMFKVIVERPRRGSRHAGKSKLRYDKSPGRSRVSGKRLATEQWGYHKHLNENLAPLRRYLGKQVGRKWDDVFSEICETLDTGSTVKMHVREHIDDFIIRKVRRDINGVLIGNGRWGPTPVIDCWIELYVDPDDGRVRKTRELCRRQGVVFVRDLWAQKRAAYRQTGDESPPIRFAGGRNWYVRLSGIWYVLTLSHELYSHHGSFRRDQLVYDSLVSNAWREQDTWQVEIKRQLSRKDLKNLGLKNLTAGAKEAAYD